MSNKRFASWPSYSGRRVLLEDDTRLVKAPVVLSLTPVYDVSSAATTITVPASERVYDITGVSALRLQYDCYATSFNGFSQLPAPVYLVLDYQLVTGGAWTSLVSGPSVTDTAYVQRVSSWVNVPASVAALGDVRLRVRSVSTGADRHFGRYVEVHARYDPSLVGETTVNEHAFAQVVVDFGMEDGGEDGTARVFVAAPWAHGNNLIFCQPAPADTVDHDAEDAAVEGITAYVVAIQPGVGFDIVAHAPRGTWGRYLINATT